MEAGQTPVPAVGAERQISVSFRFHYIVRPKILAPVCHIYENTSLRWEVLFLYSLYICVGITILSFSLLRLIGHFLYGV